MILPEGMTKGHFIVFSVEVFNAIHGTSNAGQMKLTLSKNGVTLNK